MGSILGLFRFNKRNWKAVLLSVLAAMIFWFFNALNKNYSANISFPVSFTYDHASFIPVQPLPEDVRINVSGLGWDLFRRSVGLNVDPLVIPLERPNDVKKIVATTLPVLFAGQLGDLEINYVLTDTVYINIEPIDEKKVQLAADSIIHSLRDGFGISGTVTINPDTVRIKGPRSMVVSFPDPLYLTISEVALEQAFDDPVSLRREGQDLIRFDPEVVTVKFDVERYVVMSDTIPLTMVNMPGRARPLVRVPKVPISFRALETTAQQLATDSIVAVLDLQGLPRGRRKIMPSVAGLPAGVEIIALDSVTVEF